MAMKPRLNLIVLQSEDIFALMNFYQALGLEFILEQHGSGPKHYSCVVSGVVFELYPGELSNSNIQVGFTVPSLDDTFLALLKRCGGKIAKPPKESPQGGRVIVVRDPDGRKVRLVEVIDG